VSRASASRTGPGRRVVSVSAARPPSPRPVREGTFRTSGGAAVVTRRRASEMTGRSVSGGCSKGQRRRRLASEMTGRSVSGGCSKGRRRRRLASSWSFDRFPAMRASFFARVQCFNCASRLRAAGQDSWASEYTMRTGLCAAVCSAPCPSLCVRSRSRRSDVEPT